MERVGVVGPDLDRWRVGLGWAAGSWMVWVEVGSLQCWSAGFGCGCPLQKARKKGSRRGLRPWPFRCLSQFLSKRKERLL